jgi:AcrR family transcriptional regulator
MSILIKNMSALRKRRPAGHRARAKARTRERILEAALALFQKKGFDGTTTKAIARKARVAEGTIFNYFSTKEDIALYFFDKEAEHVMAYFADGKRLKKAPLEEKLFALIQRQLEYIAPYERFIGSVIFQAFKPSSKLSPFSLESQALQVRYLTFVQKLFSEAEEKGEIGPVGWWTPQAFWVFYLGILFYWLHDTSRNKENTLAFLDRSLKIGIAVLKKGMLG